MSRIINRTFSFAFLTVLIAGAAATASAQQASFHLPFEAKWGSLVLPPGDYRIEVQTPTEGAREFLVRGPVVGFIQAITSDTLGDGNRTTERGYLQLVKVGDVYYVTKYEEAARDTTFYFSAPKQPHAEDMASRRAINIPIKRS